MSRLKLKAMLPLTVFLSLLIGACEQSSVSGYKKAVGDSVGTTGPESVAPESRGNVSASESSISSTTVDTVTSEAVVPQITVNLQGTLPLLSNATFLNVTVSGDNLTQYRYKLGTSAGTNCSTSADYSDPKMVASIISETLVSFPDASLRLCVIGGDSLNRWQEFSNASSSTWTKDTLAPTSVLNSVPTGTSATTSLNITVNGTDVASYRYKLGVSASTDCSSLVGYSASTSIATAIQDDISALADGSIRICALGLDAAGNQQALGSATAATWTKDTLAPTAVLNSVPTGTSATTSLNITVNGTDVASYRYKLGVSASTDCSSLVGYSASTSIATAIQDDISALADGSIRICALGLDAAGNQQALGSATAATWTKDTLAPTAVLNSVPTGTSATTSLNITVNGTDVASYRYKLGVSASTDCSSLVGYSASTSIGTAIQDDISALADGSIRICVLGLDAAGNQQALGSATAATWTKYTILSLAVAKIYPSNGANWNDYIQNDDSGSSVYHQTDTACVGTETVGSPPCIHGGEKLKIVVTGYSSCTGLTASDQLGAFDWTCDSSTNPVVFYSVGLKSTKGLADLITGDGSAFRSNSVTVVLNGTTTVGTTSSTVWWSNTIAALPDNSGGTDGVQALSSSGTIYVLASSRASQGYQIAADKVAIVILSGQTLSYGGRIYFNFASDCSTGTPTATRLICAGTRYFTWVEGALSVGSGPTIPDFVLRIRNGAFYRINRLSTTGNVHLRANYSQVNDSTLCLSNSTVTYSNFYRLKSENCGLSNSSVSYSKFDDIKITNAPAIGFQSTTSSNNNLHGISVYNSVGKCIDVSGNFNSYQKLFATNCLNGGIDFSGSDNIVSKATFYGLTGMTSRMTKSTMLGVSIIRNHSYSFVDVQPNNTLVNFYIFLSQSGFRTWSDGHRFENFLVDSLFNEAPFIVESENNVFAKNMFLGAHHSNDTYECTIGGALITPGLDSNCQPQNSSTATVIQSFRQTELVGPSMSENIENGSDNASQGSIPATLFDYNSYDWSNFDNPYHAWGITRTKWYDSFQTQDASYWIWNTWNGGPAAGRAIVIDDLRPIADPLNVVRNHNYDMTNGNGAFTNGAVCPAAVHGNVTTTDQMTTPRTFLSNAFEIFGDSIGNDNGLCESSEACVYAPNFGSYQGEGDYTSLSCTFQDGTVSSVAMYAYPRNGVTKVRSVNNYKTGGNNQLSWSGSTTEIAGYLVVRRSNATVSWVPTNGVGYTAGTSPDSGTHEIVYQGALTTFSEAIVAAKDFYQIVPYYAGYYYGVPTRFQAAEFSGPETTGYTFDNPWGIVTVNGETYLASQPGASYAASANYSAVSPTITVPSTNVSLNLTAKWKTEWSSDYFYVEISTDGGTTWPDVVVLSGNQSGWHTEKYDLTALLSGSTSFKIRFRLTSNGTTQKEGIKILNFNITEN